MATNNAINTQFPLIITQGGTGLTTITDNAVLVGSGTAAITPLTVGTTGQLMGGVTSSDPAFTSSSNGNFSFTSATAATNRILTVSNTDNTPATTSQATLQMTVGGSNVGDPTIRFNVSSAQDWIMGIDNSASDQFGIASASTIGTNALTARSSGEVSFPSRPAFSVLNGVAQNNVTGDGTTYQLQYPGETFDIGSNFSSNTFTAPVSGTYWFGVAIPLAGLTTSFTDMTLELVTTNDTINLMTLDPGVLGIATFTMSGSTQIDMTAGDTAIVQLTVSGSTLTVDIQGTINNRFYGFLMA